MGRVAVKRDEQYILDRSIPVPECGCWLWELALYETGGYGVASLYGQTPIKAHRLSYTIFKGDPKGRSVLHRCDTPSCVNPDHLFLGTALQNMQDKVAKGRQTRGAQIPWAKLTEDLVRYIRSSNRNDCALAREIGVDRTTIREARIGKTWRHVA